MQDFPSLFGWKPQWKQSNHKNHTNLFWCQISPRQFDYVSGEKIKYNQTTGEEVEGFAAGKCVTVTTVKNLLNLEAFLGVTKLQ